MRLYFRPQSLWGLTCYDKLDYDVDFFQGNSSRALAPILASALMVSVVSWLVVCGCVQSWRVQYVTPKHAIWLRAPPRGSRVFIPIPRGPPQGPDLRGIGATARSLRLIICAKTFSRSICTRYQVNSFVNRPQAAFASGSICTISCWKNGAVVINSHVQPVKRAIDVSHTSS